MIMNKQSGILNNKNKINWRKCCALIAFFVISFCAVFFVLVVFYYYKKIKKTEIASSNNIEIANRAIIETKDDPFWGNADAKIVIVEFSDFQCLFCRQMMPILRELNSEYPDQIKFIYRDFLGNDNSQKAATAARCADEQGQFLTYHDKLFLNQENLDINSLKKYAREAGIANVGKFDECLDTGKFDVKVQQDYNIAIRLGIKGTPTFFINGIKIEGVPPKELFKQIIEYHLSNL